MFRLKKTFSSSFLPVVVILVICGLVDGEDTPTSIPNQIVNVASARSSFGDTQLVIQNVTLPESGFKILNLDSKASHTTETADASLLHGATPDLLLAVQRRLAIATFSFEKGDIPQAWGTLVEGTPLSAFQGHWRLMNSRSDSIERILEALGISPFKRRIMERFEGVTDIAVDQRGVARFRTSLPAGRSVAASVPLDGMPFTYEEPETGKWTSRAIFLNGRLAQYRQGVRGAMYDVRVIFKSDPLGRNSGPIMLFRWTFIPSGSSSPLVADRWLRLS